MGGTLGTEPVATTMSRASNASPLQAIAPGPVIWANPFTTVTLRAFMSFSTPVRSAVTVASRFPISACASVTPASASWSSAFVGMQPRLRQVPPSSPPSKSTVESPRPAASAAAV